MQRYNTALLNVQKLISVQKTNKCAVQYKVFQITAYAIFQVNKFMTVVFRNKVNFQK